MICDINRYSITQVLLFPVSGYANRLQAMASSAILAETIGARLRICWEPQAVVPGSARDVFSDDICRDTFLTIDEVRAEFGISPGDLPRYLTVDHEGHLIILAGHDLGEQVFMPALQSALDNSVTERTLVIIAGGKFFLPQPEQRNEDAEILFRRKRQKFYRSLTFADVIEDSVRATLAGREPFLGLHLRYSDRSHQAPTDRAIRQELIKAYAGSGITSLFIASDTIAMREKWESVAPRLGLEPWYITHNSLDRSTASSGHAAILDWRVLAHAQRLVYFAESSFAVEAAVSSSGYDQSIGLAASPFRAGWVRGGQILRSGLTYPRRHGWVGGSPREIAHPEQSCQQVPLSLPTSCEPTA